VSPDLVPILATAREIYGRVVWTHKVHEQERELWTKRVRKMNTINIWLAGVTTLLAIISASLPQTIVLIFTALAATSTVCFAVWQASSDPAANEARQRVAGKELLWIREQFLLLITACHGNIPVDQLQHRLDMLTRELTAVYKFAPDTSPEALAATEDMLKKGHFTFSDEEIDAMLPTELRKNKP